MPVFIEAGGHQTHDLALARRGDLKIKNRLRVRRFMLGEA